ncbi:Uncharacterised protein [Bordetella pertussis]|nr:Uncharacterised protein [Bordetella pertussis]CFM07180.1 Uncharacterised protein [Bordetella pertussis]CFM50637.1 Uncharacterised protein [Bordetella pertussis]CFM53149.1 Uncharacterised protein [Bordetella pertussis]CFM66334.1 Uncharacterised protein [Bordetella pertussis]
MAMSSRLLAPLNAALPPVSVKPRTRNWFQASPANGSSSAVMPSGMA